MVLGSSQIFGRQRGLAEKLVPPIDPESILGAKEWLTAHMFPNECYFATRHQSAYSELMDLSEARASISFRKFERELGRLLGWKTEEDP